MKKSKNKNHYSNMLWIKCNSLNEGRAIGLNEGRMLFAKYLKETLKTEKEIADIMGISIDEVKKLLN